MRVRSKLSLHLVAFLLAIAILVALAWQGARTQRSLLDANTSVQQSLKLITAMQEMFSSLQDIETGERGYVITGVESYLDPHQAAQARLSEQRKIFGGLIHESDVRQSRWLSELDRLIRTKLDISNANIEARQDAGFSAAADRVLNAGGKRTMDQIRIVIDTLESEERARLAAQNVALEARLRHARWIAWVGGLFAAGLLAWAVWLVNASRKRLEDQRTFLRSVMDADENLIFVTDGKRRLLLCNDAFASLSRSRSEALQGKPITDLPNAEALLPIFDGDADLLAGQEELRIPELDLQTDGRQICLQVYKRAFALSGGDRLVLTVAVDISLRRDMERMKNEFISTVSHELRTPLTAIRGALGMLVSGMLGSVNEQQAPLLDIAHKNSERLVRLINDILDIDKLESGRLIFNLSPQPLLPLVEQSLSYNLPYARDFGVMLQLTAPATDPGDILVDADRFAQIMANLLSNAVKHSPRGGLVTVAIEPADTWVEISVIDRGQGVPENFRNRIFERFAQADSSNIRQLGGTGLGLAITRSLVERMHGSIGFESEPGRGARFYVRLPRSLPPDFTAASADGAA